MAYKAARILPQNSLQELATLIWRHRRPAPGNDFEAHFVRSLFVEADHTIAAETDCRRVLRTLGLAQRIQARFDLDESFKIVGSHHGKVAFWASRYFHFF
jgi:hypothetical protein